MSKLGFPNLGSRPDIENPAFQNLKTQKKIISNPKKAIFWFTLIGPLGEFSCCGGLFERVNNFPAQFGLEAQYMKI